MKSNNKMEEDTWSKSKDLALANKLAMEESNKLNTITEMDDSNKSRKSSTKKGGF